MKSGSAIRSRLGRAAAVSAAVGVLALGAAGFASAAPAGELTYGGYSTVDQCLYWQPVELAYLQGQYRDAYLSQQCYLGRDGRYYFTVAW